MKKEKYIKESFMSSDDCSFCGTHETCGHYFRAVKSIFGGYEDERGSFVLVNTCGEHSWICKKCWQKIKPALIKEAKE